MTPEELDAKARDARVRARKRTIERARRHLKALDECAVTLGVTRLRMLELASARPRVPATVARGVQRT